MRALNGNRSFSRKFHIPISREKNDMKLLRNVIIGKDEKTEIGVIWMISGDYNIINLMN
jgi:hypothetical protein